MQFVICTAGKIVAQPLRGRMIVETSPRVVPPKGDYLGNDAVSSLPTPTGLRPRNMPQSLSAVHVHLVFSTKERRPLLRDVQLRSELHSYLGGISKQLDCPPTRIGGMEDHVHILARMGRSISQADWVKELKRVSTNWLKQQTSMLTDFAWQNGYGAFSVSQSNLVDVGQYISNQAEHHQRTSFEDEFRALCHRHKIEIDERYVWD